MCIDIIMWLVGLDTSEILSRTQKIQNLKNYFHNTISHCERPHQHKSDPVEKMPSGQPGGPRKHPRSGYFLVSI